PPWRAADRDRRRTAGRVGDLLRLALRQLEGRPACLDLRTEPDRGQDPHDPLRTAPLLAEVFRADPSVQAQRSGAHRPWSTNPAFPQPARPAALRNPRTQ